MDQVSLNNTLMGGRPVLNARSSPLTQAQLPCSSSEAIAAIDDASSLFSLSSMSCSSGCNTNQGYSCEAGRLLIHPDQMPGKDPSDPSPAEEAANHLAMVAFSAPFLQVGIETRQPQLHVRWSEWIREVESPRIVDIKEMPLPGLRFAKESTVRFSRGKFH